MVDWPWTTSRQVPPPIPDPAAYADSWWKWYRAQFDGVRGDGESLSREISASSDGLSAVNSVGPMGIRTLVYALAWCLPFPASNSPPPSPTILAKFISAADDLIFIIDKLFERAADSPATTRSKKRPAPRTDSDRAKNKRRKKS